MNRIWVKNILKPDVLLLFILFSGGNKTVPCKWLLKAYWGNTVWCFLRWLYVFHLGLSAVFCQNNLIGWTHTEPITEPSTTADSSRVNVLLMMMTDSFTFIEVKCYCHFCKWSNNANWLLCQIKQCLMLTLFFLSEFLNTTAGVNAVLISHICLENEFHGPC